MFFSNFPFDGNSGFRREDFRKEVDNTKYYEILGLSKTATPAEIKKAYKTLAVQHHPDKGGDPEKFKELGRAYEVLSDPEQRKIYDEQGEQGLDGSQHADATDIFDLFFGQGGRRGGARGKRKGEDVISPIKVTLEQVYTGTTKKLAVNRDAICQECNGIGGPESAQEICSSCSGTGFRVHTRQSQFGIQRIQTTCNVCGTTGKLMPQRKRCKECSGTGSKKERKILEVHVNKGIANEEKIVFQGEADERPNEIPGDVIFIVQIEDHPTFKRYGSDLFLQKTITLYEAICGYKFGITHLDKRTIYLKSSTGQITKPGEIRCIRDEGLPNSDSYGHGNLYVIFNIKFPLDHEISEKNREEIAKCLPKGDVTEIPAETPEHNIHVGYVVSEEEIEMKKAQSTRRDESDDEPHHRTRTVGCNHQ